MADGAAEAELYLPSRKYLREGGASRFGPDLSVRREPPTGTKVTNLGFLGCWPLGT